MWNLWTLGNVGHMRTKARTGGEAEDEHYDQNGASARRGTALAVPKGPQGQKRPADTIGCAVTVARIATGECQDSRYDLPNKVKAGHAGARARTASLTLKERSAIARAAAAARWGGSK